MRLPIQSSGSRLVSNSVRPYPPVRGVRPSLEKEGGDGCPDGMIACSCTDSSMCCDAYTEYCYTSPGGSCGCVKKSSGVAGGLGLATVGTTGVTLLHNTGAAGRGFQHSIGVTHYAN